MIAALQSLSFSAPWMLAGLAALPLIWWLLRATPPRPDTVSFPPTSILIGLKHREKTPVRSPWWLTALRILVAAAVIGALAGPHIKPPATASATLAQPLLVVVDNGWQSASRWAARRAFAEQLAVLADESGQTIYLAATAGPSAPLQPLTPVEYRQRFASLVPQPYPGDRAGLAAQVERELGARGKISVAWLADGIEDSGTAALNKALATVATGGVIDLYGDPDGAGALALTRAASANAGPITAKVLKAESSPHSGQVAAVTGRGERLSVAPFDLKSGVSSAEVAFDLPLDLRNQVARLEIVGEASAGGVFLLDGRSQRRRVGLVATEGNDDAQPLLSPTYYLERALTPFAEIVRPRTANLDVATADLVAAKPSVIILSDVGRLSGAVRERLRAFVEDGGMLIRFAGSRLEQGGDTLLPAPLREGGRTLGGAMTWTSPQTPAAFEEESPFNRLAIPKDVAVTRQVLADPAQMPRETKVWARLSDGTPLVTAARRGAGTLVFFHITANPDWSNLPISGLFVEMMRKTLEASPLQLSRATSAEAVPGDMQAAALGQDVPLKPWRVLDGFGKLGVPGERAQPIAASAADTARVSAANPPGLYGPQNAVRALNTVQDGDAFAALKAVDGARVAVFTEAKTIALAPWLFLAALCLFLLDGIACALFLGRSAPRWRKPAAAALALGLVFGLVPESRAEARAAAPNATASASGLSSEAAAFAMAASLETRFAYVLTGNAEADRVSQAGLAGLSRILSARTAVEPGEPIAVDPAKDELVFFPLIYWPVMANAEPLPDHVLAKVDAYMKQGGLIIFDTKNEEASPESLLARGGRTPLAQLLGKLDIPPLQRVPDDHVLTRSFYLLQSFPGRWDNGDPWVEARQQSGDAARRGVKSDGVSSLIVTSNDLASAWAMDDSDRPMFAVVPGGEDQREMSYRVGVNIAMYALTGNYKADQVHVPAILERLGH
ncbi:RNA-binding protein [Rhodomicrobium udaipurense JA643]|uniref:DUF4159 domain-containing protein n=1 Tax=Rhodomicrobium udaipurense TaxID=1202716 RepID=A0A8I1GIY2_9HYPH|nr:DUF4159 domain-containing protein [Rhodomicrobium udaipurense]KAI95036.1 RNA-binding protein [Rhodomicrobium udaipurense JA643]MBJ7544312.1 DUF4159 domain-containing protein [Rhodomicrobium udaipurense]